VYYIISVGASVLFFPNYFYCDPGAIDSGWTHRVVRSGNALASETGRIERAQRNGEREFRSWRQFLEQRSRLGFGPGMRGEDVDAKRGEGSVGDGEFSGEDVKGEGFVGGEAEAGGAGWGSEVVAVCEIACDFASAGTHAEEHGNGFVDGAGRKPGEPTVTDTPGGKCGDAERKIQRELFADFDEEIAVEGVFAESGVEVDLEGRDALDLR